MSTLRFADFVIDGHRRRLLRGSEPLDLSPRDVGVLWDLAAHAGQTVSKEALLERHWRDVHVTDNALTFVVTQIRKVLGDDAADPKFIQTVARRGYRFVAEVVETGPPNESNPLEDFANGRLVLEALDALQLHEATRSFERALPANEHYSPVHVALASAYFLQSEWTRAEKGPDRDLLARAVTHAERACDLDASSSEAWATLSLVLTATGEFTRACDAARLALRLRPNSWRHRFRLALACWGEERLEAVDRTLDIIDFAPAYFLGAMVWIARGRFAAAEEMAAKGAALQSRLREDAAVDPPRHEALPAFGLHWLLGLLELRTGEIDKALASFEREVNEGRRTSIYYPEYCVNALIGAGHAHRAAENPAAARDSFHRALAIFPADGRALLGLQLAAMRLGLPAEAKSFATRVDGSLGDLIKSGRLVEAAMLRAAVEAARGDVEAASGVLEQLLQNAPRGQVGWMIPIDPALVLLRDAGTCQPVFARLATGAI